MNYKGFRDLECHKEARQLRIFISKLVNKFPPAERYMLKTQILDSSRSVAANIAEGYGRYTYLDTRNFFIIARGSVTETMEHLSTANDEGYISSEEFLEGDAKCQTVLRLINGYIAYLDKARKQSKSSSGT